MGISVCVMRLQVETELLHVSNSLELLYYTPKKKRRTKTLSFIVNFQKFLPLNIWKNIIRRKFSKEKNEFRH